MFILAAFSVLFLGLNKNNLPSLDIILVSPPSQIILKNGTTEQPITITNAMILNGNELTIPSMTPSRLSNSTQYHFNIAGTIIKDTTDNNNLFAAISTIAHYNFTTKTVFESYTPTATNTPIATTNIVITFSGTLLFTPY